MIDYDKNIALLCNNCNNQHSLTLIVYAGTTTEDLWTPYRELAAVVESYLTNEGSGTPYAVHTFESVLRRHKQTFLALLKNPVC